MLMLYKAHGSVLAFCRKLAVFDTWSSLAVHIAMDNTVVMEEISKSLRVLVVGDSPRGNLSWRVRVSKQHQHFQQGGSLGETSVNPSLTVFTRLKERKEFRVAVCVYVCCRPIQSSRPGRTT
jgi:hypothetical protein